MNPRWTIAIAMVFLAVAIPSLRHASSPNKPSAHALKVLLPHPCSEAELMNLGDGRSYWLRYLTNQRDFLNGEPTAASALPSQVAMIMESRAERVLTLAADPRLSYGEVASDISRLAQHTPDLVVLLATTSETGPIDPIKRKLHAMPDWFFACPPRNISGQGTVLAVN